MNEEQNPRGSHALTVHRMNVAAEPMAEASPSTEETAARSLLVKVYGHGRNELSERHETTE